MEVVKKVQDFNPEFYEMFSFWREWEKEM